jgi:hypothetical protein
MPPPRNERVVGSRSRLSVFWWPSEQARTAGPGSHVEVVPVANIGLGPLGPTLSIMS